MPQAPVENLTTHDYKVAQWVGETGTSLKSAFHPYEDLMVQAFGTGTVNLQGSVDGVNFVNLKDRFTGAAIALDATTGAIAHVLEAPSYLRCVVTTGTATVTVIGYVE